MNFLPLILGGRKLLLHYPTLGIYFVSQGVIELTNTFLASVRVNNIWLDPIDSMLMGICWTLFYRSSIPLLRFPWSWVLNLGQVVAVVLFWLSGSTWFHTGFYAAVTVYPYLMALSILQLREYLRKPAHEGILGEFLFRVSMLNFGYFGIMILIKGSRFFVVSGLDQDVVFMNANIYIGTSFIYLILMSLGAFQFGRRPDAME